MCRGFFRLKKEMPQKGDALPIRGSWLLSSFAASSQRRRCGAWKKGAQELKKKDLLIVHEEALFFVLGVRHYGALEEDFVARITPCRAFRKMHQFTLRNLENELEPLMFSKLLIHIHPKACHSRSLHIERYSFKSPLSIEKSNFYKKNQKLRFPSQ